MSTFSCRVEAITIQPHPNADRLEIGKVGEFPVVVGKGLYKTGDLVAYLPEASVLPEALIAELELTGKLAGREKNRVVAMRLRDSYSLGLCVRARPHWKLGDDVTAELGVTKYEPEIPTHLAGEVYNAGRDKCVSYDIENWQRHPGVFPKGEEVVYSEKCHGTFAAIGIASDGTVIVHSKGLGAQGLAFKLDAEKNTSNVYVKTLYLDERYHERLRPGEYVLGEIMGGGVQKDFTYGVKRPIFRVFDVTTSSTEGIDGNLDRTWLDDAALDAFCKERGFVRVPILYRGPFSADLLQQHANGNTTFDDTHMREGVVVRPVVERSAEIDGRTQRAQLKFVSEAYRLRKGGTEYT